MSPTESIIAQISRGAQRGSILVDRLRGACRIKFGSTPPANSRREAACIVDGDELALLPARVQRRALESLAERLHAGNRSVLLLLDHAHANAVDILRSAQQCYAEQFKAGAVVIGVENIPRDGADALVTYSRAAHAPVLSVDLRNVNDLLRLDETLVATRVAGTLRFQRSCFTCSDALFLSPTGSCGRYAHSEPGR